MTQPDDIFIERFDFIEFLLLFTGKFTRSALVKRFNIGEATASRTIAAYLNNHPSLVEYQGPRNGYLLKEDTVLGANWDAEAGLKYIAYGILVEQMNIKSYGVKKIQLHKSSNTKIVATLTSAICMKKLVAIEYISTSSGSKTRTVAPHSLFESAGAWYFRAYDMDSYEFRTFKFNRIASAVSIKSNTKENQLINKDVAWHRMRIVQLAPHPKNKLPNAQLLDLGIQDGEIKELVISEAMLGFELNNLRVDCSKNHKLNYFEYPLALMNREQLERIDSMHIAPGYKTNK